MQIWAYFDWYRLEFNRNRKSKWRAEDSVRARKSNKRLRANVRKTGWIRKTFEWHSSDSFGAWHICPKESKIDRGRWISDGSTRREGEKTWKQSGVFKQIQGPDAKWSCRLNLKVIVFFWILKEREREKSDWASRTKPKRTKVVWRTKSGRSVWACVGLLFCGKKCECRNWTLKMCARFVDEEASWRKEGGGKEVIVARTPNTRNNCLVEKERRVLDVQIRSRSRRCCWPTERPAKMMDEPPNSSRTNESRALIWMQKREKIKNRKTGRERWKGSRSDGHDPDRSVDCVRAWANIRSDHHCDATVRRKSTCKLGVFVWSSRSWLWLWLCVALMVSTGRLRMRIDGIRAAGQNKESTIGECTNRTSHTHTGRSPFSTRLIELAEPKHREESLWSANRNNIDYDSWQNRRKSEKESKKERKNERILWTRFELWTNWRHSKKERDCECERWESTVERIEFRVTKWK